MWVISKQVRYWKSLSRLELYVVIAILLGGFVRFLKFLLEGA